MNEWVIYFEICGKKLKTTVMAENEIEAKDIIQKKIIFRKVVKPKNDFNEAIDNLKKFCGL